MPLNPEEGDQPMVREVADRAELDAISEQSLLDHLKEWDDTGFFSLTKDPEWPDIGYVGMDEDEAVAVAERGGIAEVRVVRLPFRSAFRLDRKPERLNLAISQGRVIRAAT